MENQQDSFTWSVYNDSTVNSMLKSGATPTQIIGALAKEKKALMDSLIDYNMAGGISRVTLKEI